MIKEINPSNDNDLSWLITWWDNRKQSYLESHEYQIVVTPVFQSERRLRLGLDEEYKHKKMAEHVGIVLRTALDSEHLDAIQDGERISLISGFKEQVGRMPTPKDKVQLSYKWEVFCTNEIRGAYRLEVL